ncbi:ABC transporter transmembrane domain-containing protein [Candidatus Skiveiella danica]|uniref:ABC transporter transmembrane domain-containing protein n=1 Tax=Candidatus Skiveiella danica TaxID=3386177 RepID=UPI001D5C14A0|nr:hypothetical protein [Betaproteobacteria bacterium]
MVPLALTVAGAALMMLRIDARLTLMVALMVPLFYLLLKVLGRRLRPLSSQWQQAHADSVAIAEENLSMLPAIKTFTREPLESARYRDKIESILHLSNQERLIYAALGPGAQFLAAAGMVLMLWQLGGPARAHARRNGEFSVVCGAADPPREFAGRGVWPDPAHPWRPGAPGRGADRAT